MSAPPSKFRKVTDFFKVIPQNTHQATDSTTNVQYSSLHPDIDNIGPPTNSSPANLVTVSVISKAQNATSSVAQSSIELPSISTEDSNSVLGPVNQPHNFVFPSRQIGNDTFYRSFKAEWFQRWPWIHYSEEKDAAFCYFCLNAEKRQLFLSCTKTEKTFIADGFRNWRKATEKFNSHQAASYHREACSKLKQLQKTPITAMLSKVAAEDQIIARNVLKIIFESIQYLGRQGLALRSHNDDDGNFWHLVNMRCRLDEIKGKRMLQWLSRRDNWMSGMIQNEIIQLFGSSILNSIQKEFKNSYFFGLTADGTVDCAGKDQISITIQYLDSEINSHNRFVGFYNAPDSSANTISSIIMDVLLRLQIPLEKLAGYCFDNARNMSGSINGVQAQLKQSNPSSLYIHCANHSLDLILQEAAQESLLVADTLSFVAGISSLIRESSKRLELFASMFNGKDPVKNLVALCPTRWCIRAKAIQRILDTYREIHETLAVISTDKSMRGDSRAKARGLLKTAKSARIFYGMLVCKELFVPCEAVAKQLQGNHLTANGAQELIGILKERFQSLRNDEKADYLFSSCTKSAEDFELNYPVSSRKRITTLRLRTTNRPEESVQVDDINFPQLWRRDYFEVIDILINELERRFDQHDFDIAVRREKVLLAYLRNNTKIDIKLEDLLLPDAIDKNRLSLQLALFSDLCRDKEGLTTLRDLANFIASLQSETRKIFAEIEQLISLCLVLPISVASSERSFSGLRRLKTWMRTTMTQERLTHLALMNNHKELLDDVNISDLMKTFVLKTHERSAVFGV